MIASGPHPRLRCVCSCNGLAASLIVEGGPRTRSKQEAWLLWTATVDPARDFMCRGRGRSRPRLLPWARAEQDGESRGKKRTTRRVYLSIYFLSFFLLAVWRAADPGRPPHLLELGGVLHGLLLGVANDTRMRRVPFCLFVFVCLLVGHKHN